MAGLGRICTSGKLLLGTFGTLTTLLAYFLIRTSVDEKWYYKPAPCFRTQDMTEDLIELATRLHRLLEKHQITHFLCYGTLWGALRHQKSLPWDNNVDFCVMNQDLTMYDEGYLYRMFRGEDLGVRYDNRHGLYEIRFGKAVGNLVIFEPSADPEWLQRVGWESRLLSGLQNRKFPHRLAKPPLSTLMFHDISMPAPREDIEIQKFFYPEDWWIEVKPPGC